MRVIIDGKPIVITPGKAVVVETISGTLIIDEDTIVAKEDSRELHGQLLSISELVEGNVGEELDPNPALDSTEDDMDTSGVDPDLVADEIER